MIGLKQFFESYYHDDNTPALILIMVLNVEQIEYHSLLAVDNEVLVKGSEATARVDVKAALGTETLTPSATLNKVALHQCALFTVLLFIDCHYVFR